MPRILYYSYSKSYKEKSQTLLLCQQGTLHTLCTITQTQQQIQRKYFGHFLNININIEVLEEADIFFA